MYVYRSLTIIDLVTSSINLLATSHSISSCVRVYVAAVYNDRDSDLTDCPASSSGRRK